jgi:hypothetical protein
LRRNFGSVKNSACNLIVGPQNEHFSDLSKQLAGDKAYHAKQAQGESVPIASLTAPPLSGAYVLTSAHSNAVASPVAGVIMIRTRGE